MRLYLYWIKNMEAELDFPLNNSETTKQELNQMVEVQVRCYF